MGFFLARDEIIRTNYKEYSLLDRYIDVMVADVTRTPFRMFEIFDAIITDRKYQVVCSFKSILPIYFQNN